jgi:nucleosome binding factor SPN SPT16 subunit
MPSDLTLWPLLLCRSQIKKLSTYALLISDMVAIAGDTPDVLTKLGKNLTDIAYNINEDQEDDDDEDGSEDDDSDAGDDEKYARKVQARESQRGPGGVRTSSRLAREQASQQDTKDGVAERELKQIRLMERRNEERLRELARKNRNKDDDGEKDLAEELEAYKKTRDYPDNVQPNQVRVDMAAQCVLLPVCGNPIPFHISTIKNVVMPDADNATLLRINFFTPGVALGKEAPTNMVKLVQKYAPYASFIREMTFRSLDGQNLTQVRTIEITFQLLQCVGLNNRIVSVESAGVSSALGAQEARATEGAH